MRFNIAAQHSHLVRIGMNHAPWPGILLHPGDIEKVSNFSWETTLWLLCFNLKLSSASSWSRTTGFSRLSARWRQVPILCLPRRVWGRWAWIPTETGSFCSTCWRSTAMTPWWCRSSCAAAEGQQKVLSSSKCCTTGFSQRWRPLMFLRYYFPHLYVLLVASFGRYGSAFTVYWDAKRLDAALRTVAWVKDFRVH